MHLVYDIFAFVPALIAAVVVVQVVRWRVGIWWEKYCEDWWDDHFG